MSEYIANMTTWECIANACAIIVLGAMLAGFIYLIAHYVHLPKRESAERYDSTWQDLTKYMDTYIDENKVIKGYFNQLFERGNER